MEPLICDYMIPQTDEPWDDKGTVQLDYMEIKQLRPQEQLREEEPIEEPEEEVENKLQIDDYLGHGIELGPDLNLLYHSDPVF